MKTKKLRILIAQIVWQRSDGSLFPLQNLKKIFFSSDLTYAICVCEICGIFVFFILPKYFYGFVLLYFACLVTPGLKKGCTPINVAESVSLPWAVPIEPPHSGSDGYPPISMVLS